MINILILSGDRQLAAHTADYLKLKGYQATALTDPQQAIVKADSEPPALAIIDLLLAGRSGIEFLYELRSYPEWHDIPVIITGHQHPADIQPYKPAFDQLNVAAYLSTPLTSLSQLEQEVHRLLRLVTA